MPSTTLSADAAAAAVGGLQASGSLHATRKRGGPKRGWATHQHPAHNTSTHESARLRAGSPRTRGRGERCPAACPPAAAPPYQGLTKGILNPGVAPHTRQRPHKVGPAPPEEGGGGACAAAASGCGSAAGEARGGGGAADAAAAGATAAAAETEHENHTARCRRSPTTAVRRPAFGSAARCAPRQFEM